MTVMRHPREHIADTLGRIYAGRMTTTSGGNLSIRCAEGDVWITPAATDKGAMAARDVVRCRPDGTVDGLHRPSSELPFHRAIYSRRPDLGAIIHAHPPALVAFSVVGQTPDTRVLPHANRICRRVGFAPYEVPGSEALGRRIADAFSEGGDAVIMENHGTVIGGRDMDDALRRLETLERCAETLIRARRLGEVQCPDDSGIAHHRGHGDPLLEHETALPQRTDEQAVRDDVARFVRRACRQGLMISTHGAVSVRLAEDDFVITPSGRDRWTVTADDLVRIHHGKRITGAVPSRATRLHRALYRAHPALNSIILAQSPNATAFAITGCRFDTRTIPESYVLLRNIPTLPFTALHGDGHDIAATISSDTPVVLLANVGILTTGSSLLEAYDRLEVAEFSARSVLDSQALGTLRPIDNAAIAELHRRFGID